jgi:hypothetical protein
VLPHGAASADGLGSDRAADAWREDHRIEGTEPLALYHLYRTMAWLGEELPAGEQAGRVAVKDRLNRTSGGIFGQAIERPGERCDLSSVPVGMFFSGFLLRLVEHRD